ncbi:MAG TPA: hypothetical protein VEC35_22535 [Noviherbaspirillum sp.]|nr:hypothetical protein [Noviherbaspirillum sp.]
MRVDIRPAALPALPAGTTEAASAPSSPTYEHTGGPRSSRDDAYRQQGGGRLARALHTTYAAGVRLNNEATAATIRKSLKGIDSAIDAAAATGFLNPAQAGVCRNLVKGARIGIKMLQAFPNVVDKVRSALDITENTINSLDETGIVSSEKLASWRTAVANADQELAKIQGGTASHAQMTQDKMTTAA